MLSMKLNALILLAAGAALAGNLLTASADTTFARDALKPYVENGQLPGAISVFAKPGAEEIACVGYADVAAKRPIKMDDVYGSRRPNRMACARSRGRRIRSPCAW